MIDFQNLLNLGKLRDQLIEVNSSELSHSSEVFFFTQMGLNKYPVNKLHIL